MKLNQAVIHFVTLKMFMNSDGIVSLSLFFLDGLYRADFNNVF